MAKTLTAFEIHVPAPGLQEIVSIHGIHARNYDENAPVVLLLHGMPQNLGIWHVIAPELAKKFHVVATDLRGYGQSSKVAQGKNDENYSKRNMAQDQIHVMNALGYKRFYLVGHDRGGRVAHRLAVDHPDSVIKLLVLDICPTLHMYQRTDRDFANAYWHWFFLIQQKPLPETLVGSDPASFCALHMRKADQEFDPTVFATYLEDARRIGWTQALVADYRASAPGGIDLKLDAEDLANDRKITCPTRCLYGKLGAIPTFDVTAAWTEVCAPGMYKGDRAVPCGHYVPEHAPADVLSEISTFFQ